MKQDYIVYVDESGDSSLIATDAEYPIFVLVFCIFSIEQYMKNMVPAIQSLKFKHFGHDAVVLHEHDIVKASECFINRGAKKTFLEDIANLVISTPFSIISVAVEKNKLKPPVGLEDAYSLALSQGLSLVKHFVKVHQGEQARLTMVLESRGKKRDQDLLKSCRSDCLGPELPVDLLFAEKKVNCCGLQMADLVARPIGRALLNPLQINRAFQHIMAKLYRSHIISNLNGSPGFLPIELRGVVQ